MTESKKDLFITRPIGQKLYHVFGQDERSLCGKVMILKPDKDQCEEVEGDEIYQKGQDCKACFRKAGLGVDQ